jgi:CubicO group peptidase (beta-lactamase class C family)
MTLGPRTVLTRWASVRAAAATVLVVAACSSRAGSNGATGRLDDLFAMWNRPESPGCALGVARNGVLAYERGYGAANLDLAVPITPASVFDVASVSKQFTAMSVLLLAGQGKLSLDDDVGTFIPDWGPREHRVTIRHLLTHTSGLRDAFTLQGLAPETSEAIQQKIVNILARARGFNFPPGTQFEYNNGAYTLLAAIVEHVSGQPFAAFTDASLFKPLGMTHTHVHDDAARIVPNRATGYVRAGNGFRVALRSQTDTVVGNAGVFSTVGDLLRWEQNLADVRVGDPKLVAEMQTPFVATGWSGASEYGFGVEIGRHRGLRTIGHAGGDEGRRSYVVRYPERALAIAVLCNLDDIDPAALSRSVADSFLGGGAPESADAAPAATAAAPSSGPVSLSPQELQSKVGLYRNLSDGSVGRIFIRDGKLMASEDTGESGGFELTPIAANRFAVAGTPVVAEFVTPAGQPQELRVSRPGAKPQVSQLIAVTFAPSQAELRAFEGTYTSGEIHGTYTLVARDEGLAIEIPTRSAIGLQPLFNDAFGGNMVGVATFARDSRGDVTGFTANAPAIRGLSFRRSSTIRPSLPHR